MSDKYDYIPEELEILIKEMRLQYNLHPPIKIDLIHRKYSHSGKINRNQWREIKGLLNFSEEDNYTADFFNSFLIGDEYSLRKLLLLGNLLSYGSFTEKAKLLFEIMDVENTKVVSKGKVEQLVDDIIDIAINKVSLLVEDDPKTSAYLKFLARNIATKKEQMMKYYYRNHAEYITQEEFIDHFYKGSATRLLTASGIRKYIYYSSI